MRRVVFEEDPFTELFNLLDSYHCLLSFSDSKSFEQALVASVLYQLNLRFQDLLSRLQPLEE